MSVFTVNLNQKEAKGNIRNILGICNSPRISSVNRMEYEKPFFRKLNPARVRHHDAAIENPGYQLVDVSRIFPLFNADENNPENYDFAPTDLYFKQVVDCGFSIELRLGEQIEHSQEKFKVIPPDDFDKWARICVNIIRHFNDGWANGMHLGIEYCSVWEEPDNPLLFAGPFEKYLELFKTVAAKVKAVFPKMKIGGPNTMGASEKYEQFLKYCAENQVPLDVAEFTCYSRDPGFFAGCAKAASVLQKKYGFNRLENFISEWHYWPKDFMGIYTGEMDHAENAAFSICALIRMLDAGVDMAYYYAWSIGRTFSLLPQEFNPLPVYYALCYFTEMAACKSRLIPEITGSKHEDIDLLAGVCEDGSVKLLVSGFKAPRSTAIVKIPGYSHCHMKKITDSNLNYEVFCEVSSHQEESGFCLDAEDGGSAVYLMKFTR